MLIFHIEKFTVEDVTVMLKYFTVPYLDRLRSFGNTSLNILK